MAKASGISLRSVQRIVQAHQLQPHRVFAPLAFVISAFVMLFTGLKLLVSNWRLTLVQILPAMWIWLAMFDLKAHALHGQSFDVLRGPVLIPIGLVIVTLTVASYFLNAVFAFAISQPRQVEIRPAVARARRHWVPIIISGASTGALLAFSTTVVTRWGRPWFTLSLGIIVGVLLIFLFLILAACTVAPAWRSPPTFRALSAPPTAPYRKCMECGAIRPSAMNTSPSTARPPDSQVRIAMPVITEADASTMPIWKAAEAISYW